MWTQQLLEIFILHVLILLSLVIVIILPYQSNYLQFLKFHDKILIFIYINIYFNYYINIIIDSISFRYSILLILCPKIYYIVRPIYYSMSINCISIIVQLKNIIKIYSIFTCHRNCQKQSKIMTYIISSLSYIHPSSGNWIFLLTVEHLYFQSFKILELNSSVILGYDMNNICTCIFLYNYDYE